MKLAYFTAGSAGAGHVIRGLALGASINRQNVGCELRMFLPVEPFEGLRAALAPYSPTICPTEPDEVLDPVSAPDSLLAKSLLSYSPDLLIADLFWAPLTYIAPLLKCEIWLIVRSCPQNWFGDSGRARFDPTRYQRVIGIEPLENPQVRESIDPIVICNPDEAKTRRQLCEHWQVDRAVRIVVISHAGMQGEIDDLRRDYEANGVVPGKAHIIQSDLRDPAAVFPIAPWLPAADLINCSAGYNSYWEARWMGYAHKTRITVIRRSIDDPLQRIRMGGDYTMVDNGADVLVRSLVGR